MRVCAVTAQMSSFEISHSKTAIHPGETGGEARRAHGLLDGLRARCIRLRAARTVCLSVIEQITRQTGEGREGACVCIAAPPSVTYRSLLARVAARNRVIAVIRYATPFLRKSAILQTRDRRSRRSDD